MASIQSSYRPEWVERGPDFSCASCAGGPGLIRVTLNGELDLATAPQLADALARVPEGAAIVILDLSELTFMDSSGLHVIVAAQARLAQADCRLVLVPGSGQVQGLFELTGTERHLEFTTARKASDLSTVPSP